MILIKLIGEAFYLGEDFKLYKEENKFYLKNNTSIEEIQKEEIQYNMANPWSSLIYKIELNNNVFEQDFSQQPMTESHGLENENKKFICFCESIIYDGIAMSIYGFGKTPIASLLDVKNKLKELLDGYNSEYDEYN